MIVDDLDLRRYALEQCNAPDFKVIGAHLTTCDHCRNRMWRLHSAAKLRAGALRVLVDESGDRAFDEPPWYADDFYCCPVQLIGSGIISSVSDVQIKKAAQSLPVFPFAAQEALRAVTEKDVSYRTLDRIVASDQVIAAEIIRAANSALFFSRTPISTLGHAIRYMGIPATRDVVLTTLIRPWIARPEFDALWRHSVRVAKRVEYLSSITAALQPGEVLLVGLVHDIGKLLFQMMPSSRTLCTSLRQMGWPDTFVERTICGSDHAELGADLLRRWSFPPYVVDAVKNHHTPEYGIAELASLVYICEETNSGREDVPSEVRLDFALDRVGVEPSAALALDTTSDSWVEYLAVAG